MLLVIQLFLPYVSFNFQALLCSLCDINYARVTRGSLRFPFSCVGDKGKIEIPFSCADWEVLTNAGDILLLIDHSLFFFYCYADYSVESLI